MLTSESCPHCGTELPGDESILGLCPACLLRLAGEGPDDLPTLRAPQLSAGQVLGDRYEIRALLGRGGMGEVWRASDLKLKVEVALKALRRELVKDEIGVELLREEVRSAREVISPNVCRVFDLITEGDQELVSMEYIDGTTLLEILKQRGPLEIREAGEIAAQFLAGLEAIHEAGLVHRDLKPENIMRTRTGRVVVMDLGIAKAQSDARSGTISGTPAYMAPEQARGEAVDARADVYSAGIVLAEMVSPDGVRAHKSRQALWQALREDPRRLPEGPWKQILARALAWRPDDRYPSASTLARALEEITLRVGLSEERSPYPGLASFSEADAEYFFGREQEVETLWKKLARAHLLALIGASGAGKSSFLRAGLVPARPEGWSCVLCTPGNRPFMELAQALVDELAGDAEAMRDLLQFEDQDVAVSVASRWRRRHQEALLIVDQFEELFTLNSDSIQASFAGLLGRLVLEADVHVLVSIRDDFLLHCHGHEALQPMFMELTPLSPPAGAAMRRALVQPALICGYRFEDDQLLDDMLHEVTDERGALPLLAFAAASLWDRRDRQEGILTREAYQRIGGVGGALAQHAESTLDRIGAPRLPVVREIFRHLVTSQGTRAVLQVQDLLSAFEPAAGASQVLRQLIDARLLTSFEETGDDLKGVPGQQVEIIHESLLEAWPRLVRWRTQDADQTQLRDQLRQVAQVWEERGRAADLLWTGTSYKEFELWRERYRGRLTATEEAYARAMETHAKRRQRQRRVAVAATIAVLLSVVAVISGLWLESRRSERRAVAEARRAESSKLFALGQLEAVDHPTLALAYAISSLELTDNPEVRRFALKMLWRGPTAFLLGTNEGLAASWANFSYDGRWLQQGTWNGKVRLWADKGAEPAWLEGHEENLVAGIFSPDSRWLVNTGGDRALIWSLPEVRETWSVESDFTYLLAPYEDRLVAWKPMEDRGDGFTRRLVKAWPLLGGDPEELGVFRVQSKVLGDRFEPDPSRGRLLYVAAGALYELRLDGPRESEPRPLLADESPLTGYFLHPLADRLLTAHRSAELKIWSRSADGRSFVVDRTVRGDPARPSWWIGFDPTYRWFAGLPAWADTALWDLEAPGGAEPLTLRRGDVSQVTSASFHPSGRWLGVLDSDAMSIWPLGRRYPSVWGLPGEVFRAAVFDPGGEWLALTGVEAHARAGRVWLWPLDPRGDGPRLLYEHESCNLLGLDVSPDGSRLAAATSCGGIVLIPLSGEPTEVLSAAPGVPAPALEAAFDPHRRRLATGTTFGTFRFQIWDLASRQVRFQSPRVVEDASSLDFTDDGKLIVGTHASGLHLWDPEQGTSEALVEDGFVISALSPDGRSILGSRGTEMMHASGRAFVYDLETRTSRELPSHGERVSALAWHPSGDLVVTGSRDGSIRVGAANGDEPHLLLGHEQAVQTVAVDPKGNWILSAGEDGTVRLWPMPDGRPLHALPYDELLERLRSLTNYRIVEEQTASTGYRLEFEPFEGWNREAPAW